MILESASQIAIRPIKRYPTVTAGSSETRTRVSSNLPSPSSTFDGTTYNDFVLSFDFSYQANSPPRR
jgi:hypothetical protein